MPEHCVPVEEVCNMCHRLHEFNAHCPLRIADAYTMQPGALERLTSADRKWIWTHPTFSVLDTLEDAIAELM